ncbi:hypothetical protein KGQ20_02240 [Catenulispora sp. NF23]|uniref:Uncharacterized protein n=1 Tax=Catenulispora pinistramenti TaxID=2705254 RepID=A0ABS5KJG3_9ACTN|nr:hypothetical protein [Catenulispora pinistramenti]MBS2531585.1 hypothetical protein [Catenulispora pinistramenti]MBS2546165.1 hypothetical protein [Catenulispora pinistramenti]
MVRGGEIQRGHVVAIRDPGPRRFDGSTTYLALALADAATAACAWCSVVGIPTFGIAAASGLGARLDRFHMLDYPDGRTPDAVAIMADAYDLIVWNPPRRLLAAADRRIRNRIRPALRQRGAALVVNAAPHTWQDADLHLTASEPQWAGLGQGSGHLTGRQVTITATGRAAAGYEPSVRLWLPDATGAIHEATSTGRPGRPRPGAGKTSTARVAPTSALPAQSGEIHASSRAGRLSRRQDGATFAAGGLGRVVLGLPTSTPRCDLVHALPLYQLP